MDRRQPEKKSKAEKAFDDKNSARADYVNAAIGDMLGGGELDAKSSKQNVAAKADKLAEAKEKFAEALDGKPKQRRARPQGVRLNPTESAAFGTAVASIGAIKTPEELRAESKAAAKTKTTNEKGSRSRDSSGRGSL